ncbi:MAG: hypothetical protein AAF564_05360 [Bacteroidota bacterium]
MKRLSFPGSLLVFACLLTACEAPETNTPSPDVSPVNLASTSSSVDEFGDYWYQGEAELTSYTLEQSRYGEVREGTAMLIFVTEDFSKSKQVKLDYPSRAGDDKVSVLKLNATRNFTTGIYPYSMMSSVFTPIPGSEFPRTLKVATSSQEWCGHTFTQINRDSNKYHIEGRSYFESEGDQDVSLDAVMLEDEVWNAIRLDPELLPTGKFKMIPGTMIQRLDHMDFEIMDAEASMEEVGDNVMQYVIKYPVIQSTLHITFNKDFPHEIEGWEETRNVRSGPRTTKATRNKRMMLAYWNHNNNADLPLRAELGLE